MFQFPGLSTPALCVQAGAPAHGHGRVPPFGDPRVRGCLRLTAAYRSLPRPSSTSYAKASTVCPYYLHLTITHKMRTWVSYHSRSLHANHTSDFSRIEESSDDSKYLYTLCNFQGARPACAGPRENPRSRILRWESAARPAR